ncbi:ankyrin repeat domain-containing protein [Cardinium endosymbiont of Nabis limbatus]|uniref:ankyrin repeat domain-containing protein n=1 Tax=Cardinium endosymbiont of Nabis limbatus TaxID=3066217 RepID=UPI003AF33544
MSYLNKIYIYTCAIFLFGIAYAQPVTTYMDPSSASLWSTTNSKLTPLHLAAAKGDLSELNRCLQQKAHVNSKDQNGHTPLHWAAYYGHEDCVRILIAHKAIITSKSKQGATSLHIAIFRGHLPVVKLLAKDKKALNIKDKYGHNPLQIAIQSGQPHCLKVLLENGGAINCKAQNGYSLLHLAAHTNQVACIKLLLERGIDLHNRGKHQETALHVAVAAGHLPAIHLLVGNGANIYSQDKAAQLPLHWAVKEGHAACIKILSTKEGIVDARDKSGKPPLFFAVKKGYDECITTLVQEGANPNLFYYLDIAVRAKYPKCIAALVKGGANVNELNAYGFRPLDIAITRDADCVKMLIKMGAHLNLASKCDKFKPIYRVFDSDMDNTQTGLHSMIALIQNGADLDTKNDNIIYDAWRTPLHKAAGLEQFTVYIQPLIDGGADLTIQDERGKTPLEVAKQAKNKKAIVLLEAAVMMEQKHPMEDGFTPLHKAVGKRDIQLVKKLIAEGARVNKPDQSHLRLRPLHLAALINNVEIMEILIDHGAYVDAQDGSGSTPIFHAIFNNYAEAVAKLIEKGADIDLRQRHNGHTLLEEITQNMAKQFPDKHFTKIIKLIQAASKER